MNIVEEFVMLALHDEKGTVHFSAAAAFPYAMAGAILSELAVCGGIDYKDKKVLIHSTCESQDPIIDDIHTFMKRKEKTKSVKHWVYQLGSYVKRHQLLHVYCERFAAAGFLKKEEKKVLFLLKKSVYPTSYPEIKEAIRERLRLSVRFKGLEDERDLVLLSLLHASGLEHTLFSKEEYAERKKDLKALVSDPAMLGKQVTAVVTEIQTAVMAGVIAVSATAAAASSSNSN